MQRVDRLHIFRSHIFLHIFLHQNSKTKPLFAEEQILRQRETFSMSSISTSYGKRARVYTYHILDEGNWLKVSSKINNQDRQKWFQNILFEFRLLNYVVLRGSVFFFFLSRIQLYLSFCGMPDHAHKPHCAFLDPFNIMYMFFFFVAFLCEPHYSYFHFYHHYNYYYYYFFYSMLWIFYVLFSLL